MFAVKRKAGVLASVVGLALVLAFTSCDLLKEEKTFTITFDADNGSPPATQSIKEGDRVSKPADPVKDGYFFIGWHNAATDEDWSFNTTVNSDVTLRAQWFFIIMNPAPDDFDISGTGTFVFDGNYKQVTVTPYEGKSTGAITVKYSAEDGTDLTEYGDFPMYIGRYAVTFDVAETEGWNGVSDMPAGTIIINDGTPAVPKSVNAAIADATSIKVSWSSVPTAAGYNVYYITEEDEELIKAGTTDGTSYTHTELTAETPYWYFVTAVNDYGESDYSDYKAVAIVKPDAPAVVEAVATSSSTIDIRWSSVSGATSYKVYYNTTGASGAKSSWDNNTYTKTSCGVNGTNGNTTYYFFVTAVNTLGESDYAIGSVKTPANGWFANLQAWQTSFTDGIGVTLQWDIKGQSNYNIYYTTGSPSNEKYYASRNIGMFMSIAQHHPLNSNTTYYYWITYILNGVESGFSEMVSVTLGNAPPPSTLPATPPSVTIPSTPPKSGEKGSMICTTCGGNGKCHPTYDIAFGQCNNGINTQTGKKCGSCNGTGKCSRCNGVGRK